MNTTNKKQMINLYKEILKPQNVYSLNVEDNKEEFVKIALNVYKNEKTQPFNVVNFYTLGKKIVAVAIVNKKIKNYLFCFDTQVVSYLSKIIVTKKDVRNFNKKQKK